MKLKTFACCVALIAFVDSVVYFYWMWDYVPPTWRA